VPPGGGLDQGGEAARLFADEGAVVIVADRDAAAAGRVAAELTARRASCRVLSGRWGASQHDDGGEVLLDRREQRAAPASATRPRGCSRTRAPW
jgi:NAD(P)-dependent dehydrogenase (short-subunit alcohol dehydrogenase family)